jgi:tRNA (cytidine/uridine-2'-O-)-methyltransferase
MDDRLLRRAGLDYHEFADVARHASWDDYLHATQAPTQRCFAFTTRGARPHTEVAWRAGDSLVFGQETAGLPSALRERFSPDCRVRLPMRAGQRSLNLSNAVAVAVFEAWRQCGFEGGA